MKLIPQAQKKSAKSERERKVLLSLIEHYIKTAKPVGSNTLKDVGFADLSSATIRNYFAHLDEEGYLIQQHTSGGRIPTNKAYRLFAQEQLEVPLGESHQHRDLFEELRTSDTKAIAAFLQSSTQKLSEATGLAAFLSAPKLEHDFITSIRFITLDSERFLAVLLTDFGEVITEVLNIDHKLSSLATKRIEGYCNWRLTGHNKPENLSPEEEEFGIKLYNELIVRYIVSYTQFDEEDIYRTGFSTLLSYPEFHDPALLADSLALFEHTAGMRLLLKDCSKHDAIRFWVGEDLKPYVPHAEPNCTVVAIPYYVGNQPVGAIGILGPTRLPYRHLYTTLTEFSESISQSLTNNLFKYKITLRQPKPSALEQRQEKKQLLVQEQRLLLEQTH